MYDVTFGRFHATILGSGISLGITHSVYVLVALGIRHAMRMGHIVICGVSYFSTLSHNRKILGKRNVIQRKKCVLIFSTNFV